MTFRLAVCPRVSLMTWTELAGSTTALGLNNDATEMPVVSKEEETPVDNANSSSICSLPWDIGTAVGICLMDPGLQFISISLTLLYRTQ